MTFFLFFDIDDRAFLDFGTLLEGVAEFVLFAPLFPFPPLLFLRETEPDPGVAAGALWRYGATGVAGAEDVMVEVKPTCSE